MSNEHKIKRRNYTFALTKDNELIIPIVEKYPRFAYIKHDKDEGVETHYHYYIEFDSPRYLSAVAKELDLPENMIEQVYSKKAILAYLTHEGQRNKHHYSPVEVVSNFDIDNECAPVDIMQEAQDWWAVLEGRMPKEEFMMAYKGHFATMNIRNRIDVYTRLYKDSGTEGLSPFRVPCSKSPPEQGY